MKHIFLAIMIIIFCLSCKAQSIISIEQAAIYNKSDEGLPETVTYVKDINNKLNQFVGNWNGSYDGKIYRFQFIKKVQFGEYSVKWDKIIGRVLITKDGNTIYNSQNIIDDNKTYLWGHTIQNSTYILSFVGDSYCNDSGDVFIEINKTNPNVMYLNFVRDTGIYDPAKCLNYDTYIPLLPKEKMVLIK